MRNVLLCALLVLLIAFGVSPVARADTPEAAEVHAKAAAKAIMDQLADAYAKRDTAAFLALFSPDENVVVIGTGADEKRIGMDAIKLQVERDWAQTDAASLKFTWTLFSAHGNVVWVAADVIFHVKAGPQEMDMPARVTLVFEKHTDKWLIEQGHFSFPAATQAEGQSFPTK